MTHSNTTLSHGHRRALLILHIASAVGVLGADLALLLLALREDYASGLLLAEWLIEPLAVTALVTGILLATLGSYGLFRYWWTAIKLTITAVLNAAVFLLLTPALERAVKAGTTPSALSLLLPPAVASTLLLVNVALAVAKPAARLSGPRIRSTDPKENPV